MSPSTGCNSAAVSFLGRYSMLDQKHVHWHFHSHSNLPCVIFRVCTYGPATLEAFISFRSIGSSPCRASACACAEVNSNHHLATLTIEPFHRMQFRNGILLGPIFHAVPKTCARARSSFQTPATKLSCIHLRAVYTGRLHFVSGKHSPLHAAPALAQARRPIPITI